MATASHRVTETEATARPPQEAVVVRFAGDSGDGMQLTGGQFTLSTALAGNDLATFPDFPAEIRAPQGTTFGVSAFQINFGSTAASVTCSTCYAGLGPNFVGLYQFNVQVPNVSSSSAVPFSFTLGGAAGSQKLFTAVQ